MSDRGSVLVFTLWVLVILAIFSIVLSRHAYTQARLARYELDSIKAVYLARAGVVKMLAELIRDKNRYDVLCEDWNRSGTNPKEFVLGGYKIFYGARDETARLNLNSPFLKKEHLVRLGLEERVAEEILFYKEKKENKRFEFMEELFLVEGVNLEAYSSIKDFVTIYRGTDFRVNINTAPKEVLFALIGDESIVQDVLEYRKGRDGLEGTEDDGFKEITELSRIDRLEPASFRVDSEVFRIWAHPEGLVDKGIEAVIDRNTGHIYHWKEY